jgi:hypothetical protein
MNSVSSISKMFDRTTWCINGAKYWLIELDEQVSFVIGQESWVIVTCHLSLVIGYWSWVISHCSLVIGHLSFVTCHLSLVIGYWSWVMGQGVGGCRLHVVGYRWQESPVRLTSTHLCFFFFLFLFSLFMPRVSYYLFLVSCFIFHISKIYRVWIVWVPSARCLIEQHDAQRDRGIDWAGWASVICH